MIQTFYLYLRILRFSACFILLFFSSQANSQKIDFDRDNQNTPTSSGYTQWIVPDISTGSSQSLSLDEVIVTVGHGTGSKGNKITRNWYKNGLVSGNSEQKLISDGITSKNGSDNVTSGSVAIMISLQGLSEGIHTLTAYHNNVDFDPDSKRLPPIAVRIAGTDVASSIVQSQRASSLSECAKSNVTFVVHAASETIDVEYYTYPSDGQTYDCTSFYINSLEIDNVSIDNRPTTPSPAHLDFHAAADNGSITLSWVPSANTPESHTIYFSDDKEQVASGSAESVTQTSVSLTKEGLSPLKTYYWRVDETIDGVTYPGEVWSFRPRRDAFPGAEGYGRYAIGGRGGSVYHVTSLDDDPSNPAYGTFRYGISSLTGPRTIVFDIAGVITLKNRLTCSDPYVTIAGQTAPGNGILLRGAPFGMASDGITRFLRLRLGHIGVSSEDTGLDGMGMAGNDHSIMDHCSISWTIDEGFSSRNARNITLQRTLISEALNAAGHPNYDPGTEHGYAATIGGGEFGAAGSSYHHNLLAHNEGRNWSMSGSLDGNGYYDGHHDMFNNVVYNWGGRACDGGTHQGQFVNNYYKMGKATTQTILLNAQLEGKGKGSQSYYVSGNIRENRDGSLTPDQKDVTYKYSVSGNQVVDWTVFQTTRFFDSQSNVETAEAAYHNVLCDVGCNQPVLDNHDQRMVSETLHGSFSTTGSYDQVADGLIDSEEDAGCEGFDGLNIIEASRPDDWDTDQDGIPDWFEKANGWSTAVADNNACDDHSSYYTHLEEYLNWMAEPHFINLKVDVESSIDLSLYFLGYATPSFSIVSSDIPASISGTALIVTPTSSGLFQVLVKVTEGGLSLTRSFLFHVKESEEAPDWNTYTTGTANISSATFQEDVLSDDGTMRTWRFSNGFAVQNAALGKDKETGETIPAPKTYATGNNGTVKYSRNVDFTIFLPSGMEVTGVEMTGYTNGSNQTSRPVFNGTEYADCVFPDISSSASHTISFSQPLSGSVGFKVVGNNQACLKMTFQTRLRMGDLNMDGFVTVTDAMRVVDHVIGVCTQDFNSTQADVNLDGTVGITDLLLIINHILTD